jgi:hypothetical protein
VGTVNCKESKTWVGTQNCLNEIVCQPVKQWFYQPLYPRRWFMETKGVVKTGRLMKDRWNAMSASSHMLESSFCTASPSLCARAKLTTENMNKMALTSQSHNTTRKHNKSAGLGNFDSLWYRTLVFNGHEIESSSRLLALNTTWPSISHLNLSPIKSTKQNHVTFPVTLMTPSKPCCTRSQ